MGAVKNKSQNKKAKVNLISATIKNITGGLLEYTKEYLPGVTSVLEDSREIIEDVKKTTANSSGSVLSTFKSIARLVSFKNLFDWYTDQGNQFGGDEDSFGDDLNFDIGGDSGDDSSSDDLAKDLGTAEINEMKKSSDKVSKTVVETSQKMAELQVTSLAHITNSLEKTNSLITSGFESVNNSIKDLIKIVSENTASLIKIVSVGREEENAQYSSQKQFGMADLLRGGGFKAKDYFGYLKNKMSSTVGMAGTIFDMLGTLTSSPEMAMSMLQEQKKEWIGQGFHWIIEKAFPGFSRGLKNLERSVGDWFSSALIDLGKGKNPITGKPLEGWFRSIGEFFGVVGDFRGVGNLQLESFERKKISFDTETKESIVRIIPGYLREISTALGNVDKIYDYNKRSFVSTQDLRQRYQKEIADNYRVSIDTSKMQQYKKDTNGNLVKDENGKPIIEKQAFVEAYDSSPEIQAYANKIIGVLMYRAANGSRDDIVDYYKKLNIPKCSFNHDGGSKFSDEVFEILGIPNKEKVFIGDGSEEARRKGKKLNLQLTYALEMIKAVMTNPLYDNTRKEIIRQANYKTEAHMRINKDYIENVVTDNAFFGTIGKQSNEELIRNAFTRESFIQNKHHQAKLEELNNLLKIGGKGLKDKFTTNANNAWGNTKKANSFDEYLYNNFGIDSNQLDRLTPQQLDEVISGFTDLGYNNQDENITNFKNKLAQRAKEIDEKFNTENPSHLINSGNISNILRNSSSAGVGAAASSIRGASTTISSGITQLTSLLSGLGSLSASSPVVPTFSFDTDLTNFGNSYIEPIKDILTNYCAISNSDLVTKVTEISLILNDIKTISSEIKTVNSDKIIFEDIKKLEEKGVSSLESIKTSVQNLESYSKSLTVPSATPTPAPLLPSGPIEVKIASDSITEMIDSFKAMVAANIPSGAGTTALVPVASSGGTVTAVPVTSQTLNPWQQLGSMLGFTSAPALPAPGATVSGTTAATTGVATAGNNIFTVVQNNLAQAGQRIATAVQQGAAKVQAMTMGGEYIENKLDANGNVVGQVKVNVENGGIIGGAKDFLNKMIPSEGVMRDVFNKGKAWLLAPRPSTAKSAKGKEMDKKSEERRANLVTTVLGGLVGGSVGSLPGLVIGAMIGASEPISEIGFNFKDIVFGDLFDRQAKNPKMGLLEKGFVEFVLPFKLEVKKTWQHLWFYFKKDLLGPFQDMIAGFKNWAAKRKGRVIKSLLDWWKGTWIGKAIDKFAIAVGNFVKGITSNTWNFAKGFILKIIPGPVRALGQAAINLTGQVPKIVNNVFSRWFGADFAEGVRLNKEKRLTGLFKQLQESGNLVGFNKNDKEFNELSESSEEFKKLMGSKSYREYYEKHPEFQDKNKMEAAILEDQRKWVQTRLQLKSILFGSAYVDSDSNPFSETLAAIQGKDGKGEGNSILGWLKTIAGALSPNGANGGVVISGEGEAGVPQVLNTEEYLKLLEESHKAGEIDENTMNQAANRYKDNVINARVIGNGTSADNIADALKEGKIDPSQAKALLERINAKETDQSAKDDNTRIVNDGIAVFNAVKNNEQKANGPVENPIVKFFKGIWDFTKGWFGSLLKGAGVAAAWGVLPGLVLNMDKLSKWAKNKTGIDEAAKDITKSTKDIIDDLHNKEVNTVARNIIYKISKYPEKIRFDGLKKEVNIEVKNILSKAGSMEEAQTLMNDFLADIKSEASLNGIKLSGKEVKQLKEEAITLFKNSDKFKAPNEIIKETEGKIKTHQDTITKAEQELNNLNSKETKLKQFQEKFNNAKTPEAQKNIIDQYNKEFNTKTSSAHFKNNINYQYKTIDAQRAKLNDIISVSSTEVETLANFNQNIKQYKGQYNDNIFKKLKSETKASVKNLECKVVNKGLAILGASMTAHLLREMTLLIIAASKGCEVKDLDNTTKAICYMGWGVVEVGAGVFIIKSSTNFIEKVIGHAINSFFTIITDLAGRKIVTDISKAAGKDIEKSLVQEGVKKTGSEVIEMAIKNVATKINTWALAAIKKVPHNMFQKLFNKFIEKVILVFSECALSNSGVIAGGIGWIVTKLGMTVISGLFGFIDPNRIFGFNSNTDTKQLEKTYGWQAFLAKSITGMWSAIFNCCDVAPFVEMFLDIILTGVGKMMGVVKLLPKNIINIDVISIRQLLSWLLFDLIVHICQVDENHNLLLNKGLASINALEEAKAKGFISPDTDLYDITKKWIWDKSVDLTKDQSLYMTKNGKYVLDSNNAPIRYKINGKVIDKYQMSNRPFTNSMFKVDDKGFPLIDLDESDPSYSSSDTSVQSNLKRAHLSFLDYYSNDKDIINNKELHDRYLNLKNKIKKAIYNAILKRWNEHQTEEKIIKELQSIGYFPKYYQGNQIVPLNEDFKVTGIDNSNGSHIPYTSSLIELILNEISANVNQKHKGERNINSFNDIQGVIEFLKTYDKNNEFVKNSNEYKQEEKDLSRAYGSAFGDGDQESNGIPKDKEKEAQSTGAIAPVTQVPNTAYIYPVENYSKNMLVSDFYNNRGDHIHGGVDIAANAGTGIRAASDGWLVHKGWENPNNHGQGYGYFLVIKDPKSGNKYIYGHMQKFSKEIDQLPLHGQIKKGTYLGEMGSTGHSTGPHLHFEIRKGAPGEGDDYGTEARAVDVSTALATRYDPIKYLEDNGVAAAPTDKNNQISEGSIVDLNSESKDSSTNLLNELLGFDKIGALINKFLGDFSSSKTRTDKGSPYTSSNEGFIDTSKYKFNKVKGEKISISKKKQEVASKVYNVLRAKGFSHSSAAAILGNLWQESTLTPDVVNRIGATGMAQWLDTRKDNLMAFAKKWGNGDWKDPEIQARFLAYELSQGGAYHGNKNYYMGDFNNMDLDQATVMWRKSFERCAEWEANDENRLRYAHYFDKAFAKNSGGESPFEQLNFLRYRNLLNHNKNLRFKSQLSSKLSQFPVELSNLQSISNVSNINNLLPQLAAKETASKKEDSLELKQIAQLLMKVIEAIEAGNMLKSSELKNKITDATQMNNIVRQFENNIKSRTAKFKTTQPFNSPFPTAISSLVLGI